MTVPGDPFPCASKSEERLGASIHHILYVVDVFVSKSFVMWVFVNPETE
jgi:hypothetical protein